MYITILEPHPTQQKSFNGKAQLVQEGSLTRLRSYETYVAEYNNETQELKVYDTYSATTTRHVKAFVYAMTGEFLSTKEIKTKYYPEEMTKMKYLLTLHTDARYGENTTYCELYPTIKALKQELSSLIKTGKITVKHDGAAKHKIRRASISKRIQWGDWLRIKDTNDGIKWNKAEWGIYYRTIVTTGKSIKTHIEKGGF